jgi:hypothetical protein
MLRWYGAIFKYGSGKWTDCDNPSVACRLESCTGAKTCAVKNNNAQDMPVFDYFGVSEHDEKNSLKKLHAKILWARLHSRFQNLITGCSRKVTYHDLLLSLKIFQSCIIHRIEKSSPIFRQLNCFLI